MSGIGQFNKTATRWITHRNKHGSPHPRASTSRYVFSSMSIGLTDRSDSNWTWAHSLARCSASSSHIFQVMQRFQCVPPGSYGKSNGTAVYSVLAARCGVMLLLFNNRIKAMILYKRTVAAYASTVAPRTGIWTLSREGTTTCVSHPDTVHATGRQPPSRKIRFENFQYAIFMHLVLCVTALTPCSTAAMLKRRVST